MEGETWEPGVGVAPVGVISPSRGGCSPLAMPRPAGKRWHSCCNRARTLESPLRMPSTDFAVCWRNEFHVLLFPVS